MRNFLHSCLCRTQYQKHYANDADELERNGLFKKSQASVAQRDDMKRLRSEDEEKHKEDIDHDSKHDKTVANLLAQCDGVDSKLHDERIITVREAPHLHIGPERCPRMECAHPGNFFVSFNAVVNG